MMSTPSLNPTTQNKSSQAVDSDVQLGSVPHMYSAAVSYLKWQLTWLKSEGVHTRSLCSPTSSIYPSFLSSSATFSVDNWTMVEIMKTPTTNVKDIPVVSACSTVQLRHFLPPPIHATLMACVMKLFGQPLHGSRECHTMTVYSSTATMISTACTEWRLHKQYASFLLHTLTSPTLVC